MLEASWREQEQKRNTKKEELGCRAERRETADNGCRIDSGHLKIWDALYSLLTPEEQKSLFSSMRKTVVGPREVVLSHGERNSRLFFIDRGKVTILLPQRGTNVALAQLGPGNLLGEYTFTSLSLCSATAITHTEVELCYLDSSEAQHWQQTAPELYRKLVGFCVENGSLYDISRLTSLEKRSSARRTLSLPICCYLQDDTVCRYVSFDGVLSDISLSGCSFMTSFSDRERAREMLGQVFRVHFGVMEQHAPDRGIFGRVVKINISGSARCSVHMQFCKPVRRAFIEKLCTASA